MSNPTPMLTWENLKDFLNSLYRMKHNEIWLRQSGKTPEQKVEETLRDIRSGSHAPPSPDTFNGPTTFMRAVGHSERPYVYTGGWWFKEEQLLHLTKMFSRTHFGDERKRVVRDALRQVTAVSVDWGNPMTEIWELKLPAGTSLTGLVSVAKPQPVRQSDPSGARLTGGATQIYFPVKNPLWISR